MKIQRKNLAFLALMLVFMLGALLTQSCDKDPLPVVPEELKPTLEVSTTPQGVLPYGKEFILRWKTTNANTFKINGISQYPVSEGLIALRLFKDTIFEMQAINVFLSAKADKEVHVGDWTTSEFGLVSYYPWKIKEYRIAKDEVIVYREDPTIEEKSRRFYYHKNGDLITNYLATPGKWSISDDGKYITRDGQTKRFKVTGTELILYQETTWNGQPAYALTVLEHASTTPTDK